MKKWSLIIAASQRSGSTLMGRALELTEQFGKPSEWLQTWDRQSCLRRYGMSPDTPYEPSVHAIVANESTADGVFPLKIMWDTFEIFMNRVAPLAHYPETGDQWQRLCQFFADPRFILVTRRNKLKQAVSFVKSLQTGVWEHRGKEVPVDDALLAFDYLEIAAAIRKFEQEEAAWLAFFAQHHVSFLHVEYEDFVADYDGTLRNVFAFLNQPCPADFRRDAMDLKVMSNHINADWIRRFKEIQAGLPTPGLSTPNLTDARSLNLMDLHLPDKLIAGSRFPLSVVLHNAGSETLVATGDSAGNHWLYLQAQWLPTQPVHDSNAVVDVSVDPARGLILAPLPPDHKQQLPMVLTAPAHAGDYLLRIVPVLSSVTGADKHGEALLDVPVHVQLSDAAAGISAAFPSAQEQLGDWYWIPWLGYFYMGSFPWMCSNQLGWLLFDPQNSQPQCMWFWENSLGWFWTSPDHFPRIFAKDSGLQWQFDGTEPDGRCRFIPVPDAENRLNPPDPLLITPKFK